MILAQSKKTGYRIVTPAGPSAAVSYAAGELARYLTKITGAFFPVVTDAMPSENCEIVLGKAAREGAPDASALTNDGYILKTVGEKLFLTGENDRAVLYAVYGLLEQVGCRFLAPDVESIPDRDELTLDIGEKTVIPPFEYREAYWNCMETRPDFAVKRGMNASITKPYGEELGGSIRYNGFVHTFKLYIPDEEFFETHPEYFTMVDGKRQPGPYAQLCLSNPDVFRIMLERALKSIAEHPECKIISLSQNDGFNPCTCPECARIDAEEGGYAGSVLRFVNKLAREIGKVYPDILIDTLAYRYTRQAPLHEKPEPNICVRMCTIECCFSHPIPECTDESNAEKVDGKETTTFLEDMDNWRDICDRMFIWDYTTDFHHYLAPFPNLHVLQKNIQYFIDHHVTGLFEQGNGETISGEFGELRAYLISKLMWEPDGDVSRWMNEFLTGYYGAAAAPIRAYIDMLSSHVVDNEVHVGIYNTPESYLPDELLRKAAVLWNEAESLVSGDTLERVRRSRLQLTYAELRRMPMDDPARKAKFEAFAEDVRRFGITRLQEFRDRELTLTKLSAGDLSLC